MKSLYIGHDYFDLIGIKNEHYFFFLRERVHFYCSHRRQWTLYICSTYIQNALYFRSNYMCVITITYTENILRVRSLCIHISKQYITNIESNEYEMNEK